MSVTDRPYNEPLLRRLANDLRKLEASLRRWLDAKHTYPRPAEACATLEMIGLDLRRQADALDVDQPLLIIMLMGGTGVGKSTLLNALAGGAIARASFARPTTTDPVVYYHESVQPERLDPALRYCHLAMHDRPALQQKVIVDTPDIDSNVLAHRETLERLLPVADVVLYVGSQEKYHDRLVWEKFLQQRQRRAFAFVLNKWDRCLHAGASGLRPDEDLLRDLEAQGFKDPLLFRTCAQAWVDKANGDGDVELPEGEQFPDLVRWIEMGLTGLEIVAVKNRGVSLLLQQLEQTLQSVQPPDLTEKAAATRAAWERDLAEEATAATDVLLNTLQPYQREIEHHFTVQGYRRFHGLMAAYFNLWTKMKYLGSTLRDRVSLLPRPSEAVETPTTWNVAAFTSAATSVAGERHLDARCRALADRLLVEANQQGFPLELLNEPTGKAARMDWRKTYAEALVEVLQHVENQWSNPTGLRRFVQTVLVWTTDIVPPLVFFAALVRLLWLYFMGEQIPQLGDVLLPVIFLLVVLVIFHGLVAWLLPLRWRKIRDEFRRLLERQLNTALVQGYATIPAEVAGVLLKERVEVDQLLKEAREIGHWLEQRQQAASIMGMYGK
jgi:energy-coupling factor transporter ATP-binding protein EcfA2